jgi:hypothetical protein
MAGRRATEAIAVTWRPRNEQPALGVGEHAALTTVAITVHRW